jgi:hypothetical protein
MASYSSATIEKAPLAALTLTVDSSLRHLESMDLNTISVLAQVLSAVSVLLSLIYLAMQV